MIYPITPYKQHRYNCAIACLLMILEYKKIIPKATYFYEKEYEKRYYSRYMEGTPFSAIAYHLSKNHLKVKLVHSEKDYFTNANQFLPDSVFQNTMKEYQSYLQGVIENGGVVETHISITIAFLQEQLNHGYVIVLAGMSGKVLHEIVLCGYESDNFVVCDPFYKKQQLHPCEEIEKFMDTSIGKWCILVKV